MKTNDIDGEIDKLKYKKIELANRLNMAISFEDKEEIKLEIQRVQNQIETLEKYKGKF